VHVPPSSYGGAALAWGTPHYFLNIKLPDGYIDIDQTFLLTGGGRQEYSFVLDFFSSLL